MNAPRPSTLPAPDRALVTGACGFVGRNLVRRLLDDGAREIWLVDDLSTGAHPDGWLPEMLGDTATADGDQPRDYRESDRLVRFYGADALAVFGPEVGAGGGTPIVDEWPTFDEAYHLASIVGGRVKIEEEPLSVGLDLAIDSVFLLWVARHRHVERLLYASSSAAYPIDLQGVEESQALEESAIDFPSATVGMPDMTYGWSKLTGEYLTYLLATHHGVSACAVRPFSGYGEDQDLTYPVPAIADRAARREDPLVVWGTGQQGRDFVHIDDCITAMRTAIHTISDGSAVNIGTGLLTNFLEVARLCAEAAGYAPEIRGTKTGPVGVHARYADPGGAERMLGWTATIPVAKGLARVVAAQEERLRVADGAR